VRIPSSLVACFLLLAMASAAATSAQAADTTTVKVFILAGQSNMEGKAKTELLDHQAEAPPTKEHFAHLRSDGEWIVRKDVFIKFLNRKGGLTIGYGSPGRTGVELEFGTVVGDHFEEPVLLIKTAWGGHSLYKQFRPPSAGFPAEEKLQAELAQAQNRVKRNNAKRQRNDPPPTLEEIKARYGSSYREMLREVQDTLEHYQTLFPALEGTQPELAGFVWFQGWNDQYGGAEQEYAENMEHFIKDVRKDLDAPKLPFVIGVMGQNGSKPAKGAMLAIQMAQLAMQSIPEFQGNVKAVRTDLLVDKAAEKLYPEWKKRFEEWKLTGSDFAYHYMGSAIWFTRIGHAMGKAMLELQ